MENFNTFCEELDKLKYKYIYHFYCIKSNNLWDLLKNLTCLIKKKKQIDEDYILGQSDNEESKTGDEESKTGDEESKTGDEKSKLVMKTAR